MTNTDLIVKIQAEAKADIAARNKRRETERDNRQPLNTGSIAYSNDITKKVEYLFVDDLLLPRDVTTVTLPMALAWGVIRSFQDFKTYIDKHGAPTYISFDFNLGDKSTGNGVDCVNYLIDYCIKNDAKLPNWIAHSTLETGRQAINNAMLSFGKAKKKYKNEQGIS